MNKTTKILLIWAFCALFSSIKAQTLIVYGDKATAVEINASKDLAADYKQMSRETIEIVQYKKNINTKKYENVIYVGTTSSNSFIKALVQAELSVLFKEALTPETYMLKSFNNKTHLIIGADVRGVFYGVYEFSKRVVGTDPNAYWIGYQPQMKNNVIIPTLSYRAKPPVFKYRGYFDNDNDLLANFKGRKLIVELDLWKEIINTVARLGYNYIDIHDLLGRPEYYLREYYINLTPFHTDLKLVDEVIDYAHSKGLLVQIPMYLGWEFKHISLDETCLTTYHDKWMATYEYYLTQTPIAKADLFLQRPRHPIYDWAYKCEEETKQGIKTGDLMNKMFEGLAQLIHKYRPEGVLFCDLWSEGRPLWESGEFSPNKNIQMLWADGGHANFKEFPKDLKGYEFGIYIHAGVWYNNVTQSPYPDKIKEAALLAVDRKMTSNFLVNGQTFKDFLLNINACGLCAWDPVAFNPETFYKEWTTKYFGKNVAPSVIKVLKLTYDANQPIGGFRNTMNTSVQILTKIAKKNYSLESLTNVETSIIPAEKAFLLAKKLLPTIAENKRTSYIDQIAYPSEIYLLNLKFLKSVILFNNALSNQNKTDDIKQKGEEMKQALVALRNKLTEGSGWEKWQDFYKPENFRIHTPPPTLEMMDKIVGGI